MSPIEKTLLALNLAIYLSFCIFSYAFVDLNLTISQNPQLLSFVKAMQLLGYYNRPLSSLIYTLLILISFGFFVLNLTLVKKHKISTKYIFLSTMLNTILLIFAYPFLSSDIFNYMFDAKIIVRYHANPYLNKPLDFAGDEWLRFMRWVHRYSPYGPLWLGFSTIPYILGFGKFITTLLSFKFFISIFHIINSILIYKVLKKINSVNAAFGTALYSLNPLFLIEGIANSHNDVILAVFFIGSVYFAINNKKASTLLTLLIGVLIKYIPLLTLPWLILLLFFKKLGVWKIIWLNLITMSLFTLIYSTVRLTVPFISSGSTQVQFQPWYLFWTLPFISLINTKVLVMLSIAFSLGASLRYLPFIYYGDWSHPNTIEFMKFITFLPAAIILSYFLLRRLLNFNK